jgi:protein TonB
VGPVEFNDAMVPPKVLSGPNPQYTDQALEHEVEGTMVVKCIVSIDGEVHGCRVLQGLPFMDRAVVDALEHRRYTPAMSQGKPIAVDYTFRIHLRPPQ